MSTVLIQGKNDESGVLGKVQIGRFAVSAPYRMAQAIRTTAAMMFFRRIERYATLSGNYPFAAPEQSGTHVNES